MHEVKDLRIRNTGAGKDARIICALVALVLAVGCGDDAPTTPGADTVWQWEGDAPGGTFGECDPLVLEPSEPARGSIVDGRALVQSWALLPQDPDHWFSITPDIHPADGTLTFWGQCNRRVRVLVVW